jgi:hypothetical protein
VIPPPTDQEIADAERVLRADYWNDVRGLASAFRGARAYALSHGHPWEPDEALLELVEGHERVIYTHSARLGMVCTDSPDACQDATGSDPSSVEQAMCYALLEDTRDVLGSDFNTPEDDGDSECAECGARFDSIEGQSLAICEDCSARLLREYTSGGIR